MSASKFMPGTCSRCGAETLVRRRMMFHSLFDALYSKKEWICGRCLKRSRVFGLVALVLVLATVGAIALLPFLL